MMRFLYNFCALSFVAMGIASKFYKVDFPFRTRDVLFTIGTEVFTVDTALIGGGLTLLILGFLLYKINN